MKSNCLRFLALLAALVLCTAHAFAGAVNATYVTGAEFPVTSAGYTAPGNTVNFSLGYAPAVGTQLSVVQNTGLSFINGAFDNLAQGQTLTLGYNGVDYGFVANYFGGSGNDLVLAWQGASVWGWGYNHGGELGNNSTSNTTVPGPVTSTGALVGKTVVAVASGGIHNLALCSDGTVAAWGDNFYGELGNNSTSSSDVPVLVSTAAGTSALAGKTVVAVAAGYYHSLALCSDGTVAAWGDNSQGELGTNGGSSTVPVAVNTAAGTSALAGKTVVAIAAGNYFSLAVCSDGTVAAWGLNSEGQLGNNTTTNSGVPVSVNTTVGTSALAGKTAVAVAAGLYHSLALCSDGTVVAWGYNSYGQLGNNSTSNSAAPVAVSTAAGTSALAGKTAVAINAGQFHSVALCSDGTVAAWGYNGDGELGNNATIPSSVPVAVNTAAGTSALAGKTVTAIATGTSHSVALCSDGTAASWGFNNSGQLGIGSTTKSLVPVPVTNTLSAGQRFVGLFQGGEGSTYSLALVASPQVAFEANGGTGVMAPELASAATFNLTANAFTRPGYTYLGWNTLFNGAGTAYADGASFTDTGSNVTLYAQWMLNAPSLTNSLLSVPVNGSAIVDLAAATGASAPPAGGSFSFSSTGVAQNAVSLVNGKWVFNPAGLPAGAYTIVYAINDGQGMTSSVNFTIDVTELPSLVVTTANDVVSNIDGLTSLREALAYAATLTGPQTITFGDGSAITGGTNFNDGAAHTITLNGTELYINSSVTIAGPGANVLTVSGNNASRVYEIANGYFNVTLSGLTIANGTASVNFGGGIYNTSTGTVTLTNCTLSGNGAPQAGGGIYNASTGAVTLTGSTLSGNPSFQGGGIYNAGTGAVTVTNSTLFRNSSSGAQGNDIYNQGVGAVTLINSTLAGTSLSGGIGIYNQAGGAVTLKNTICVDGASSTVTYGTDSIVGGTAAAAGLQVDGMGNPVLQYNGGPTQTIALVAGSPAIDAGNNALAVDSNGNPLTTDQRGAPRIQRGFAGSAMAIVDIGAYESLAVPSFTQGSVSVVNGGTVNLVNTAGVSPAGGTFTGLGAAAGHVDPMTGVFNSAGLGLGVYQVTYAVSDGFGAMNSVNISVTVAETPSLVVTTASDAGTNYDGLTSLREAIAYAATLTGPQTITFGDGSAITGGTNFNDGAAHTITLNGRTLIIDSNVTVTGPGANVLAISGNNASRVLRIGGANNVTLSGLTIAYGNAGNNDGGGIYDEGTGTMTLTNCALSNNIGFHGAGIYNGTAGSITLNSSTLSGNQGNTGSGIFNVGSITLTNSTLSGNSAMNSGGGLANDGTMTLTNCTVAGNSSGTGGGIINLSNSAVMLKNTICVDSTYGQISSGTDSIVGGTATAAGLQVDGMGNPILQYNGGTTQTIALVLGSPAIDAGNNALAVDAYGNPLTTDQRGAPRIQRGLASSAMAIVDIGAYESLAVPSFTQGSVSVVNGGTVNLVTAAGISPTGGTFTGLGAAAGHVDPVTGVFNSTGLGLGVYQVTYTVSDGFGAMNSANITVTVTETPSLIVTTANDVVSATDGLTSLREALAYAATLTGPQAITFGDGSAITGGTNFNDGGAHTIALNGGELPIISSVTITGPGANVLILNGNLTAGGFIIGAGNYNVSLSGLTLTNAAAYVKGGEGSGIYNESTGMLTLTNCTLSNDQGALYGGGIYNANTGAVTLTNCTFSGNSSSRGGAIYNQSLGALTLTNCTLSGNTGTQGGGGIYNVSTGTVTLTGCTLSGNLCFAGAGGGICNASTGTVTLTNSTLSGNQCTFGGDGGGICNASTGAVTLTNITLAGNQCLDGGVGGGICNKSTGTMTLNNTICVDGAYGTIASGPDSIVTGTAKAAGLDVDVHGNPILQNNGGPTQTIALVPGSPAIDAGNNALAVDANGNPLKTDQRGAPRIQRGFAGSVMAIVDIGAYESLAVPSFTQGSVSVVNGGTVNLINTAGVSPAGGTFTGLGAAAGHVDPVTGVFNSTGLALGVYQVTYTVSDGFGGMNSANITVTVAETPSLIVTTASDTGTNYDGLTSLREALAYAATLTGPQTITFGNGSAITGGTNFNDGGAHTIALNGTQLVIDSNVTLTGPGANVLTIDAQHATRAVRIGNFDAVNVTVSGLTIANGTASGSSGGGIYNQSTGAVTLNNITLSGNTCTFSGGGINDSGAGILTLINCTLSGNSANFGGGIENNESTATLINSTLSGNSANFGGGGIDIYGGTVTLINSTLAGNSGPRSGINNEIAVAVTLKNTICVDSISGTVVAGTDSIISGTATAAGLQVDGMGNPILQYNGGPTQTIALVPGGAAIDAGNNALAVDANGNALTTDQRGQPRIQRGLASSAMAVVDIGAYEALAVPTFTQGAVSVVNGGTVNLVNTAGVSPAGGTFTGVGAAAGHVDPMTGVFNSAGLGLGVYQVTYTVSDGFGGMNSANIAVTVAETPSLIVTTASDTGTNYDGLTSLREAIAYAATLTGPQTITFGNGSAITGGTNFNDGGAHTIALNGTQLVIDSNVTVTGPGANVLTIDAQHATRAVRIGNLDAVKVTVSGLTIANGAAGGNFGGGIYDDTKGAVTLNNITLSGNTSSAAGGGGIENAAGGTITLTGCTLSGNSAGFGGAIENGSSFFGTVTLINSTLFGNSALEGGGIDTYSGVTVINCTIAGNYSTSFGGGGIDNESAASTVTLKNTICVDGISGTVVAGTDSIISGTAAAAGLDVDVHGNAILEYNGGTTPTIALLPGSAAIDAGNAALAVDANGNALTTDQRGFSRVVNGKVDLGAVEAAYTTLSGPATAPSYGQALNVTAAVANATPTGGSVQFIVDGTNYGAPAGLVNGTASIAINALSATTHSISASYSNSGGSLEGNSNSLTEAVSKLPATVNLGTLGFTYDGTQKAVSTSTIPGGLAVSVTYSGSPTAPSAAGQYSVAATINDPVYSGSASGTLSIAKANSAIMFTGPASIVYTGAALTPFTAQVTGMGGLNQSVAVSYGNNVSAGTASVNASYPGDANHTPSSASTTFQITKAPATVNLGTLAFTYDGTAKAVSPTTMPGGLALTVTYNGSPTAPSAAGSYPVVATISNLNYSGSATGSLVIAKANSLTSLSGPASALYTGAAVTPFSAQVTGLGGLNLPLGVSYSNNVSLGTATASASYPGDVNHNPSSASTTFQIVTPAITKLSPASAAFGTAGQAITVTGTNFVVGNTSASAVRWTPTGGAAQNLAATNVTATSLSFTAPATLLAKVGTAAVSVVEGAAVSAPVNFTITGAPPVITAVSPALLPTGATARNVTLTGTGFFPGAQTATFTAPGGTAVSAAIVSSTTTQLTLTIPAGQLAAAGSGVITITTGGGPGTIALPIANPAAPDTAFTYPLHAVSIDVLANDAHPAGGTLTIAIATAPKYGSASVVSGKVVYSPAFNFPTGGDSFTYRYSDGLGGTGTATVTVVNFASIAGNYDGIVSDPNAAPGLTAFRHTGYVRLTVSSLGCVTGAAVADGALIPPIPGTLDSTGAATVALCRPPLCALTATVAFNAGAGNFAITVTSTDEAGKAFTSTGTLKPAVAAGALGGNYTLRIAQDPTKSTPTGTGSACVSILPTGTANIAGTLADGTPFNCSVLLHADRTLAIYSILYPYAPQGSLSGTITLPASPTTTPVSSGALTWFKPVRTSDRLYPQGFTVNPPTTISR